MKSTIVGGFVIGLLLASTPALAAKTNYKADIEGASVDSPGTGVGNFTFDDVTKRLCGKATYSGLTGGPVTVAALKEGDGFTIVKPLTVSASPIVIDVTLGDDGAELLKSGPVYIAIGNAAHGVAAGEESNGEVNGELVVDPAGMEQPCGDGPVDAGDGSGSAPDAGAPATNGGDDGSTQPPPGVTAPLEQPAPAAKRQDDGGCSTSGSPTSSLCLFAVVGAFIVAMRERRRR